MIMSHFVKYDCSVKKEEDFVKAVEGLGFVLSKGSTKIIDWGNRKLDVKAAIILTQKGLDNLGTNATLKEKANYPLGYTLNNNEVELQSDWFMLPFSQKQFNLGVKKEHTKSAVYEAVQDAGFNIDQDFFVNQDGNLELQAVAFR